MTSIPARYFVAVTPGVLSAGGTALDVIGLLLTTSTRVPINTVQEFGNAVDVGNFFGSNSTEYALSQIYFGGFNNSYVKPAKVLFAQYPSAAVAGYMRSGRIRLTLAQLQALSTGTLAIVIDGATITAPSVNLSAATSFSDAAARIQADFTATQATAAANTISGTTLTLGGAITGTWAVGQTVAGTSVTANSVITALLSGTPNTDGATYSLSQSSTVSVGEAMTGAVIPQVTYDTVLGAFVLTTSLTGVAQTVAFPASPSALQTSLNLTLATGGVISQGAAAATPGAFMDGIVQITTDWASFMTCFDPDVSGNTNKLAFATWNGLQVDRFEYACWDTDLAPSTQNPAASSLGQLIKAAQIDGTVLIGGDGTNPVTASYAAFACGYGASLDFGRLNGRTTLAFRQQSGLVSTCSTQSTADNLIANGYNFYGNTATSNEAFIWFYPGSVSGQFAWADSYIDEIWMNNALQLAFMILLQNTPSIPYNAAGYAMIEAAALDVINAAVRFGAIRAGVTLSMAQIAEVNSAAGIDIAGTLNQRGWMFQVSDASPQVRQARGSPPITFWYTDGQSIQKIAIASIELM